MINAGRSSPGSWLRNLRDNEARPGTTFLCGVRLRTGRIAGESGRWRFRPSAADELIVDGIVTIQHGSVVLRLRTLGTDAGVGRRPGHVVIAAKELRSSAEVELSLPAGEAIRFDSDGGV